jgi:hypothetical protein
MKTILTFFLIQIVIPREVRTLFNFTQSIKTTKDAKIKGLKGMIKKRHLWLMKWINILTKRAIWATSRVQLLTEVLLRELILNLTACPETYKVTIKTAAAIIEKKHFPYVQTLRTNLHLIYSGTEFLNFITLHPCCLFRPITIVVASSLT